MYNGDLADKIKKIAVIGAGTMGPGIAQSFATGGYEVSVWEPSPKARENAALRLKDGIISSNRIEEIFTRVTFKDSLEETVEGADFIMETIVENIEVKKAFYMELATLITKDVIVASNTSALNIFEVVPQALLPQQLIAHWYGPAQIVPLVDVVKSPEAPQEFADITLAMLQRCGKVPIYMKKFIRGYIVNRLLQCLNREIFYLLDHDYCTAEDIDYAAKISFIPRAMVLGLCRKIDFGGVDMTINNYRCHSYQVPREVELPETLRRMEEKGEFGIKTEKGFYDYSQSNIEELLEKRDQQLVAAYNMAMGFLDDPA